MRVVRGSQTEFVPASHEDPKNPGVLKRVLATKNELQHGQVQMVNWSRLPKGSSFQPHYHEDMQEVFVMLGGPVSMRVGEEAIQLMAGDAILIDPKEVHEMTNLSESDVEYVVFGISSEQGGKTVIIDEADK